MSGRALDPQALGDHLDRLYRAAWAMCGSREDAEDLVQETYVRVLARPRFLRGDDDLGYLLRVLRNTHVSRLRAAGRRPVGVPFAEEAPEPEDARIAWRPDAALDVDLVFTLISACPRRSATRAAPSTCAGCRTPRRATRAGFARRPSPCGCIARAARWHKDCATASS